MREDRNGPRAPEPASESSPRLWAATLEARGVLAAITKCGRAGLLSEEGVRALNDAYRDRVEVLLQAAAVMESSARTVRLLIAATEWITAKPPAQPARLIDVS